MADFTEQKGLAAGRKAYRYAQDDIDQPAGSAIYFSVDFDASAKELDNGIVPYFEGVRKAFAAESGGQPDYKVGAYGSGLVCGTLTKKGLIDFTWLAMSTGFRGTKEALKAGDFHLAQRVPATSLCGLGVDFNDANPDRPDFGAFVPRFDPPAEVPAVAAGDAYRVIARDGLRLRGGPGVAFDIIGKMAFGQVVFTTLTSGDWARVDVEGDGRIDGFAAAGFLERV